MMPFLAVPPNWLFFRVILPMISGPIVTSATVAGMTLPRNAATVALSQRKAQRRGNRPSLGGPGMTACAGELIEIDRGRD